MSNRLPVPNLGSKIVSAAGYVIPPWNSWFQQFSQTAPTPVLVNNSNSPFTANTPGSLFITSGTPAIVLTRGDININLTGQKVIPISIGDTVSFTGAFTSQFLGA